MPPRRPTSTAPNPFALLGIWGRPAKDRRLLMGSFLEPLLLIDDTREAERRVLHLCRLLRRLNGPDKRKGRPPGSPNKPKIEDGYPVLAVLCGVKPSMVLRSSLVKAEDGKLRGDVTTSDLDRLRRHVKKLRAALERDCPDVIEYGKQLSPRERLAFLKDLRDLHATLYPAVKSPA